MVAYDYIDQVIVATALIQPHSNDSFYEPVTNSHNGYAADGFWYLDGVVDPYHPQASWFTEAVGPYRAEIGHFPTAGIILLSPVALTILDQGTPTLDASKLPLWMQFLLEDTFMLCNNFDGALNGWLPSGLAYADGIISVVYTPDEGNQITEDTPPSVKSIMVVTIDFVSDSAYLDVTI